MQVSLSQPSDPQHATFSFLSKRAPTQPLHCTGIPDAHGLHAERRTVAGLPYVFVPRLDRPGFVGCWESVPSPDPVFRPCALGCVLRALPHPREMIEEYRAELLGEWPELYNDEIIEENAVVQPKTSLKKSISSKHSSIKKLSTPIQNSKIRKPVKTLKKPRVIDIKVDVLRTESDEIVEKSKVPKKKPEYSKAESTSLLPWESTPSRIQNANKVGPVSSIDETKKVIYEILASKLLPNVFEKFADASPEKDDLFGGKSQAKNEVIKEAEPQPAENEACGAKRESDSTGAGRSFKYFGTGGVRALRSPEKSVVKDTHAARAQTKALKYIPNRPTTSIFPSFPPKQPQLTQKPNLVPITPPNPVATAVVRKLMKNPTERIIGPTPLRRDSISKLSAGSQEPAKVPLT